MTAWADPEVFPQATGARQRVKTAQLVHALPACPQIVDGKPAQRPYQLRFCAPASIRRALADTRSLQLTWRLPRADL
jgi:hypothetical protein